MRPFVKEIVLMKSRVTKYLAFAGLLTLLALPLMSATGWAAGIVTSSALLPPEGVYVSPDEYHEYLAAGIKLDDPTHEPILDRVTRTADGDDELEFFDSKFTATEIGQGFGPITLTGPVVVRTKLRALSTTGTFATEIVSMSLSGGGVMIRQDPLRASTGQTDINDLGGGLYHIDSFFDVFTELSIDGGGSWIASDYSTRLTLIPEPGTLVLLGMGAVALLGYLWRRKRAA